MKESKTQNLTDHRFVLECIYFVGSQVRVVTLEIAIILLKELIMYTVDESKWSYLSDRHLALIEVRNSDGTFQTNKNDFFKRVYTVVSFLSSLEAT